MDKTHSRRATLGLAAGAAIAGPDLVKQLAARQVNGPVGYRSSPPQADGRYAGDKVVNSPPSSPIPEDFWPWQRAMHDEANRQCAMIERRKEAIMFSKSTSDAWKVAVIRKLDEEQMAIRLRSNTLVDEVREWFFKGQGLLLK